MTEEKAWRNSSSANHSELEFVLCCGRALVNQGADEEVRQLLRNGLNWPKAAAIAEYHRLATVVYEIAAGAGKNLVPQEQLQVLREIAQPSIVSGMALVRELLGLQKLFDGAGILVIPYKGPVLAQIAYGSFVRREYSDLDFVVEQKFIPELVALLTASGCVAQFDSREVHTGESESAPGQYSFLSGPQKILVEIHTERTLRYFPTPIEFPILAGRLMTVEIGEQSIRTFSVEDTMVMLCVHGAKHFWERLSWVLDIAKLATAQDVNWELVTEIAAKMESTRVLLLGLSLAHDLFAAPLPDRILREISSNAGVRALAAQISQQYVNASDSNGGVLHRAAFRVRSRDGLVQGLRHTLRLALSPTESDRKTIHLPRWLSPLYVLVRPLRLLREYGAGFKRR